MVFQEEHREKEKFNSLINGISSIPIPSSLKPDEPTIIGSGGFGGLETRGIINTRKNTIKNVYPKDSSLVLHLDAKNPLSFSGGSIWKDLSGKGNHFTLPSSGVNWSPMGFFTVNGSAVATGPSSDKFNISTDHTVIIVANTTKNICGSVLNLQAPDRTRMINIHLPWCNGQVYYDVRGCCNGTNRINYTTTNPFNNIKHWAFVTNTSSLPNRHIFENGKSMINSGVNPTSSQNKWGGRSYLWGYQKDGWIGEWNGNFYMMMIYNRALSESEIQENFKLCNILYNINAKPINNNALILYGITDNDIDEMMQLGATMNNPANSAQHILETLGPVPDGVYWILCDNKPKQVYCLMDPKYNGGGWMLMMKMSRGGKTFSFNSSHWTQKTTLNENELNLECNDAKFDVFNNVPIKDVMTIYPKNAGIGVNGGCIPSVDWGYVWLVNNWWKNGGKITGLKGFNTPRDAKPASPDDFCGFNRKIFSEQSPARRHIFGGHSYLSDGSWGGRINWGTARWGLVWNENGKNDFNSNDAWGGIGLGGRGRGEMSAGDYFGCCGIARFNGSFGALLFGR